MYNLSCSGARSLLCGSQDAHAQLLCCGQLVTQQLPQPFPFLCALCMALISLHGYELVVQAPYHGFHPFSWDACPQGCPQSLNIQDFDH